MEKEGEIEKEKREKEKKKRKNELDYDSSRAEEVSDHQMNDCASGESQSCGASSTENEEIMQQNLIEILDIECVLCHVIGVQNENKNALINPPSWIFPRSVIYKRSWGELNLPL